VWLRMMCTTAENSESNLLNNPNELGSHHQHRLVDSKTLLVQNPPLISAESVT